MQDPWAWGWEAVGAVATAVATAAALLFSLLAWGGHRPAKLAGFGERRHSRSSGPSRRHQIFTVRSS